METYSGGSRLVNKGEKRKCLFELQLIQKATGSILIQIYKGQQ